MEKNLYPHRPSCLCDACLCDPSELIRRSQYPYDFGRRVGREMAAGTNRIGVPYLVEWICKGLSNGRTWSTKSTKVDENIDRLAVLAEARAALEDETRKSVALVRESGIAWGLIGSQLGISKQAAQQKYGK